MLSRRVSCDRIYGMMSEDKSKIDELNKSLYSRNAPSVRSKRRMRFFQRDTSDVRVDWEHKNNENESLVLNKLYQDHSMSFFKKLLWGSIIFFIVCIGIGAYLVLNGSNIVSANNIDITISGPVSIAGGTPVSFDVQVYNKNNIKLETVDLSVDFPDGTVDPSDFRRELKEWRQLIDDINPGGISQKSVSAVIYGEENAKKEIIVTVSYKVKGSNATFQKQKTFDVLLNSSPISVSIKTFNEVTSNQDFTMAITLSSNSKEIMKNIVLKAMYPFGYNFISSDIKSLNDNATWKIGDIPPGGKKTITIKGRLEGQDDEIKIFRFNIGAQNSENPFSIGTQFLSLSEEITIKKPFISLDIDLEGDSQKQDYIASFNDSIKAKVSWFNNLPVAVIDGEIHVKISGNAFDKLSVTPEDGYYRSLDNEIIWNKITTPELANISPGEGGTISFSITPRDSSNSFKGITNPNISIDVSVVGNRLSENNVPESVVSAVNRKIKVVSNMTLVSEVVRSTGPFVNTGPVPPHAEKQTTYTILLSLENTVNTLSGARVETSLPANVKWLGNVSPPDTNITYNSNNGQIVWNIGNVYTHTINSGDTKRPKVAFQVGLEPSVADIGQVLILVNNIEATAQDDFTGETLISNKGFINTRFNTDPAYKDRDDQVIR